METQEKASYLGNKLPKMKLSELIDMGVRDIERCNREGIRIDMGRWHGTKNNYAHSGGIPECAVCFGGAVMACELGVPERHDSLDNGSPLGGPWHEIVPWDFVDPLTVQQLCALNSLRQGRIQEACYILRESHPELWDEEKHCAKLPEWALGWLGINVTQYADSPIGFVFQMRMMAEMLRRSGGL